MIEPGLTGVLFDLDGVLVDTEGLYSEFWTEIGERRYPRGIADFANVIKGNTLEVILNTHFPDPELQRSIVGELKEYEAAMPYRLFDGAERFLRELRDAGLRCAIVTSSGPVKMGMLMERIPGFRDFFAAVLTDADITLSKPDPQGYLLAAKAIGRDISRCFVIEDSFAGLQAGMASGAVTIGLATTNSRDKIEGRAHAVFDSIADLNIGVLSELSESRSL